jgi:cytochrome c peroxidase
MRNTPTLLNVGYYKTLYWDGRASSLEDQALKALANPDEMASSPQNAVKTISSIQGYRPLFKAAFGSEEITAERIAQALASFERTLVTGPSAFDKFLAGDVTALTPEQKEGLTLFLTRAECVNCHRTPLFTNEEFKPAGIYVHPDFGRYNWTKKEYDYGDFRTPSLRNVALTSPYFHNGSVPALFDAAFFRIHGVARKDFEKKLREGYNRYMYTTRFSDQEIEQMVAFLNSLSGEPPPVEVPREWPK